MLQFFPNILFRNSLRFYPFILLSLPNYSQKNHTKDSCQTIFSPPPSSHMRVLEKYGLVSRFFSTSPRPDELEHYGAGAEPRPEYVVRARNSVTHVTPPHISPIIPALCRILTPAYYSRIYARIIAAPLAATVQASLDATICRH